jgi:integration host factor subunit alpha
LFAGSLGQAMTGTGKTVTRVDLCEAVYQKVGLSRTESSAFVELVLKEITDCLEKGETVKLSSAILKQRINGNGSGHGNDDDGKDE